MRILFFVAAILFAPTCASAQSPPPKDFRALFDVVQKSGNETELRGDIADRLGFGDHPLAIKDLVVTDHGIQHALNAFVVANASYVLFHTRRYAPEIYIFVKKTDGTLATGIHGRQYQPITETTNLTQVEADTVVGAEEAFWFQWLADGAKVPVN